MVSSLLNCSLKMFSKCHCHRLCYCLFVGHVMPFHHSDQMSQRSKVSWCALFKSVLGTWEMGVRNVEMRHKRPTVQFDHFINCQVEHGIPHHVHQAF